MKQHAIDYDVCLVSKRISHHSGHSGYDQILKYLNPTVNLITTEDGAGYWVKKMHGWLRKHTGKKWYRADSLKMEIDVLTSGIFAKRTVYHFIYGEDDFRYSGLLKKIKKTNKVICTYHQPPGIFSEVVKNKEHLKSLDAVIVVGTNQVDYFKDLIGKGRVHFVPHGIDTDYFRSLSINSNQKGNNKTCLFVGQWLRDFQSLKKVISLINKIDSHIEFEIVTTQERASELKGLKNLKIKSNISDEDLLISYQRAGLLVLPLTDCTANNSILEAMSSGLPIVTTDVGSIRDYVDENCAFLVRKGDAETMAEKVLVLLKDKNLRTQMGKVAREKAIREFDWNVVAKRMKEVYKAVEH